MNFKKKIIFTGLSLLLSSTFNSACSAHKLDEPTPLSRFLNCKSTVDYLARPSKEPGGARPFYTVEDAREGEGGAGGGASSSESNTGKMPGDAHLKSSSAVTSDMHEELWRVVDAGNKKEICSPLANTAIGNVPEELNHRIMRRALKDGNEEMIGLILARGS